jgi:predicted membrane GTPase involved in stress response
MLWDSVEEISLENDPVIVTVWDSVWDDVWVAERVSELESDIVKTADIVSVSGLDNVAVGDTVMDSVRLCSLLSDAVGVGPDIDCVAVCVDDPEAETVTDVLTLRRAEIDAETLGPDMEAEPVSVEVTEPESPV